MEIPRYWREQKRRYNLIGSIDSKGNLYAPGSKTPFPARLTLEDTRKENRIELFTSLPKEASMSSR